LPPEQLFPRKIGGAPEQDKYKKQNGKNDDTGMDEFLIEIDQYGYSEKKEAQLQDPQKGGPM
jgi:hypothetical protein